SDTSRIRAYDLPSRIECSFPSLASGGSSVKPPLSRWKIMRARDAMLYRWMQSKTHQLASQTQQGLREKSRTTVQSEFQTRHPTLIPPRTQSPIQSSNLRGVGRVEGQSACCGREQASRDRPLVE